MSDHRLGSVSVQLPPVPVRHSQFIEYVNENLETPIAELVSPYLHYEDELRKVYANHPDHTFAAEDSILVPVFKHEGNNVKTRARDYHTETGLERPGNILSLSGTTQRKAPGSEAIRCASLEYFRNSLNVFCEGSLKDLDWSNVVVGGAAVISCLRTGGKIIEKPSVTADLRKIYHNDRAPTSDVDLYLYGLCDEDALEKVKQIDKAVRSASLSKTITIRTKHAIVIASQHPVRHVTIHLRLYRSISELLTTFDVDCSCVVYDGRQIWATPRGLVSWMTQRNTVDHRRGSPFLEQRLKKYRTKLLGFGVHYPGLDRSRIDPRVYDRDLATAEGLARLLIFASFTSAADRHAYEDSWEGEKKSNLPARVNSFLERRRGRADYKKKRPYDVSEWIDADEQRDLHFFQIPYGPKTCASNIEKMLYKENVRKPCLSFSHVNSGLLTKYTGLNPRREEHDGSNMEPELHRHPAFFGSTVEGVLGDCCGSCPNPTGSQQKEALLASEVFVSGKLRFSRSGPLRQTLEVLHPRTLEQYTAMAYIGIPEPTCQAIAKGDLGYLRSWLAQRGNDVNGRDFNSRTPLHLATLCSDLDVVGLLLELGAQITARLDDGKTAMHIACIQGDVKILSALLARSEHNRTLYTRSRDYSESLGHEIANLDVSGDLRANRMGDITGQSEVAVDGTTESWIYLHAPEPMSNPSSSNTTRLKRDFYNINAPTPLFGSLTTLMHLAILHNQKTVVRCLVEQFGADVNQTLVGPARRRGQSRNTTSPLALAFRLPLESAREMTLLLLELGASVVKPKGKCYTTLHSCISFKPGLLNTYFDAGTSAAGRAATTLVKKGSERGKTVSTPLTKAIETRDTKTALGLLGRSGGATLAFETYSEDINTKAAFDTTTIQPVIHAVNEELPSLAIALIKEYGVDCNTLTPEGWAVIHKPAECKHRPSTLMDRTRDKIRLLTKWTREQNDRFVSEPDSCKPMRENEFYLSNFTEGHYKRNSRALQMASIRRSHEDDNRRGLWRKLKYMDNPRPRAKLSAIQTTLNEFLELEALLESNGAQTFQQLYPEIYKEEQTAPSEQSSNIAFSREPDVRFYFRYRIPQIEHKGFRRWAYEDCDSEDSVILFEAVWQGDIKTVKRLTLQPRTDQKGKSLSPLAVAIVDVQNNSPFAIALSRGHYELARTIYRIAEAQYRPPHCQQSSPKNSNGSESDEFSELSEETDEDWADEQCADHIEKIVAFLADDEITTNEVRKMHLKILKPCPLSPALMFSWPGSAEIDGRDNVGSLPCSKRQAISPENITARALYRNDSEMLSCILDLAEEPRQIVIEEDWKEVTKGNSFALNDHAFKIGLQSATPEILTLLIKRTAAGIPLDMLAEQSGVDLVTESNGTYRGLKLKESRSKGQAADMNSKSFRRFTPPLLQAAYYGSFENVKWFLSDEPIKAYLQFAAENQDDDRVKRISRSSEGFCGMVRRFLRSRTKLAILCCVSSKPCAESMDVLTYLIEVLPDAVNAKDSTGLTPLHVAFRTHNVLAAKALIEAGADQTACDFGRCNVLHHMLCLIKGKNGFSDATELERNYVLESYAERHLIPMRSLMELLDKSLLPSLFTQRSGGWECLTPLASWFCQVGPDNAFLTAVSRILLDYSKGVELDVMDSEGRNPLHLLVKYNSPPTNRDFYALAVLLLESRPEILLKEDTSGKTPLELAESAALKAKFQARCFRREHGNQEYRIDSPAFSLAHTPESSFLGKNPVAYDDFGGREMADALLSGAANPSSSPGQRIESLWRLLAEWKVLLGAEGKNKRTLTNAAEVRDARKLRREEYIIREGKKPSHDGYLVDMTGMWPQYRWMRERLILRDNAIECSCGVCLFSIRS